MSIPHLFRCPISLDLFTDPVTLSTGHTYDRPSIETWLAAGNSTCPVTMQRLPDTSLVPNRTLRHLIDRWLLSAVPDLSHQPPAASASSGSGTASSLAALKPYLVSSDTEDGTKLEIVKKVRLLAAESDIGKACLVQLGYFPLLLQLLFGSRILHPEFVELGLECVLSLSHPSQLDSLNMLKDEASLATFLQLLDQGNRKINSRLCCLLEKIFADARVTRELCSILGQSRKVLQVVVALLRDRSDARAPESAVRAISGICSVEGNRGNAVREGAVDGLVSYLMSSNRNNCSLALATLEALVGLEAGRKSLLTNPNAVPVLVKSVFRVSPLSSDVDGSEYAVGALLIVCCESAKARAEAVNAGVLAQVLLLLQSQCGCKAKAKARALLKLLRSVWARGSPAVHPNFYPIM